MRNDRHVRLAELARAQCGVFARWQALELGYTHFMIARRLETKEWRRVLGHSVFMAATGHLDRFASEWAAYLACGPGAVLSGPSAVGWHDLDVDRPNVVEWELHWATIPPERHIRAARVRTIREALPDEDITIVNGMQVTTVARSIVDTLRVVPEWSGRSLLDRALLRRWITLTELQARTAALVGRRGVGRLRVHLSRVANGARSEAERLLHDMLKRAGLHGWVADFKLFDESGQLVAIVDVAFPDAKVAVEIDGLAFHTDPERFQTDRTRQNWLTTHAWQVLRFTWDDLTVRRRYVVQTIGQTVGQDPTPRSGLRENSEI